MTLRIYLRVSRKCDCDKEPDEPHGERCEIPILENQRTAALGHALLMGVNDPVIYEDVASGAKEDRQGLGALMRDIRKGDLVIFTSLSRMTRGGTGAALDILRQLEARGAGWHFVEVPILNFDSHTPKLVKDIILAVFAAIDEDYRRRISEATKASFARRRALDPEWRGPGRPRKTQEARG